MTFHFTHTVMMCHEKIAWNSSFPPTYSNTSPHMGMIPIPPNGGTWRLLGLWWYDWHPTVGPLPLPLGYPNLKTEPQNDTIFYTAKLYFFCPKHSQRQNLGKFLSWEKIFDWIIELIWISSFFAEGFSQGVDNDVHFVSEKILKSQVRFIQSTMASVSSLHKAPLRMISPCPSAARTMASGCFALEAKQQKLYEDYWWHRTWYINIFCHQVCNWSLLKLHLREPGEHTKFIHPCQVCCMESKSHFDKLLLYTC